MHNICYRTYESIDECKQAAIEVANSERSQLYHAFRIFPGVCDSYKDACEKIKQNDGEYDNIIVAYKELPNGATSSRLKGLTQKANKLQREIRNEEIKDYFSEFKSAKITCQNCGSSINRNYLRGHSCPVCRADMRPATELARINKKKEKISLISEQIEEETKKLLKKKYNTRYLIKFEYHT